MGKAWISGKVAGRFVERALGKERADGKAEGRFCCGIVSRAWAGGGKVARRLCGGILSRAWAAETW